MGVCTACGAALQSGDRFCSSCGAAATVACHECGHLGAAGSRFCAHCGASLTAPAPAAYTPTDLAEKIRAGGRSLEGERKQITVLFADVAGFTRMSAALDPEEVHGVMRRCFDSMLAEVHRYEGTVSQFLGDGLLALFGAPLSHEDHALRAVLAGLGMQESLARLRHELQEQRGIDFRVRVGLNSGLVVVGSVGVDLTMDYLAVGDTVNLASRVQSLAEPGTVVLSENTHRLVEGLVVVRDLGSKEVKGKDEPIRVYEAVRASRGGSRVEVAADRGLAPFVGREHELAMLQTRLDDARHGRGQMVMLRGDAGIGKSRLLYELRVGLSDDDVLWLTGRSVSYGAGIPYWPIVDLLKDALGIEESDSEAGVEAKVSSLDPAAQGFVRLLFGADAGDEISTMDALLRKTRTLETLRDELLRRSSERPLVLVVEDLHWADQASLEFLSYFADSLPDRRILLLVTFRAGWEHPFGERSFLTQLDLATLGDDASASLAASVLGDGALPEDVARLVLAKAEGNPFFVEEVVRSLAESGALEQATGAAPQIVVPDTVEGVLMARLDRLDEEPRRALQTASVIGREFTVRLLERTADLGRRCEDTLRHLKAVELIYERSLFPELAYMFKHALTHDVAYGSLLLERRRELHRLVALAIEELYADRLAEHVELIAHHAELGESWQQAFEFLVRSGDKAHAAFAAAEAVQWYARAIDVAPKAGVDDARLLAVHAAHGAALGATSAWVEAAAAYDAMRTLAERLGDREQTASALYNGAMALFWAHEFEQSRAAAEESRRLAEELGSAAFAIGSTLVISFIEGVTGDLGAARTHVDEVRAALAGGDDPVALAFLSYWDGLLRHWRGDEAAAFETHSEGAAAGRAAGVPLLVLENLWSGSLGLCGAGRYEEAIATLEEGLALTTRLGERIFRCRILNTLGWAYMDTCDWLAATASNRQSYDESLLVGDPEIIRNAALNLADIALEQGDLAEARHWLELVEAGSRRVGVWGEEFMKWRYTQHLNASFAELCLREGEPSHALRYADTCLEAAKRTSSIRNLVKGGRARGLALRALGRADEGDAALEAAVRAAETYRNPAQLWRAYEAAGRLDDARRVLEELADSLVTERRDTVRRSPQLARLRAATLALD